jgi:hypothetical protein
LLVLNRTIPCRSRDTFECIRIRPSARNWLSGSAVDERRCRAAQRCDRPRARLWHLVSSGIRRPSLWWRCTHSRLRVAYSESSKRGGPAIFAEIAGPGSAGSGGGGPERALGDLGLVLGLLLALVGDRLLALRRRSPIPGAWRARAQEVHLLDDHLVLGAARPVLGLPLAVLEPSCHRDQAAQLCRARPGPPVGCLLGRLRGIRVTSCRQREPPSLWAYTRTGG